MGRRGSEQTTGSQAIFQLEYICCRRQVTVTAKEKKRDVQLCKGWGLDGKGWGLDGKGWGLDV